MAAIKLFKNPLVEEAEKHLHNGALIDWLQAEAPQGFGSPVTVVLNGAQLKAENFDIVLSESDSVSVFVSPGTGVELPWYVWTLISVGASVVASKIFAPKLPSPEYANEQAANPVYTLNGSQNAARLAEAIPVVYGEAYHVPDLILPGYFSYREVDTGSANPPGAVDALIASYLNLYSVTEESDIDQGGDVYLMTYDTAKPLDLSSWVEVSIDSTFTGAASFNIAAPATGEGFEIRLTDGTILRTVSGINAVLTTITAYIVGNTEFLNGQGDQFLYTTLCLGQGDNSFITSFVGDTPAAELADYVTSEVYLPAEHGTVHGQMTGLFNDGISAGTPLYQENMITALDFAGQTMQGLTSPDVEQTPKMPVSDRVKVTKICVDLEFRRGFYSLSGSTFLTAEVSFEIEIWDIPTDTHIQTKSIIFRSDLEYTGILRRTVLITCREAFVAVRIRRLTPKPATPLTINNEVTITSVRGYGKLVATPVYGDTTLAVYQIKANQITAGSATRVSGSVKRLAQPNQVDATTGFTANAADFVSDIMRNGYGAGRPADEIDSVLLTELKAHWGGVTGGSYPLGMVFNQKTTVWNALQSALAAVAAEPYLKNGQVSVAYDGVKPVRSQLFTMANIVRDSLNTTYSWNRAGEPDGFLVEFFEPVRGLRSFVTWPAAAINPRRELLFGCKTEAHALQYAKYLWATSLKRRQRVSFETELEGLIPSIGDRIAVSHDVGDWGLSGQVEGYDNLTNALTLDQPVDITGPGVWKVILRAANGVPTAPITATQAVPGSIVVITPPPIPIQPFGNSSTLYAIGLQTIYTKDFVITDIEPNIETVKIEGLVYNEDAFIDGMTFLSNPV